MSTMAAALLFVLVLVAAFLTLQATFAVLRALAARRRRSVRLRLYAAAPVALADDASSGSLLRSGAPRAERGWLAPGPRAALELELRRAAVTVSPARFALASLALAGLGFLALSAWAPSPGWAVLGLALGLGPWLWLRRRGAARARAFEMQFPEALDLLIRALRAGHALSAGIQLVSEELPDPLGGEFAQVSHEVRLGQSLKRALDHLVLRIQNPDVAFFATAVAVQQETGSNLVEVLENLAGVIRDRFQLLGKVRALTALGRASANLLVVWPAVMVGVLWMVNADYVAPLWETDAGRAMVLVSVGLIAIGYVLCLRMATIRV